MQDHNSLQKSEISCQKFKTWTWVPIQRSCKNKHKTWFLFQTFGSKRDFLQEHMGNHFLPSRTNFKTMHDMQHKFDHAMQLDDQQEQPKEIKILTSKLGSNGSSHKDQAWKTTLTQELFFLLSRASLSKTKI